MVIHLLQGVFAKPITALAIGFLLISEFNTILLTVAVLLLCIVFETIGRNTMDTRLSFDSSISDIVMCVS